MLTVRFPNGQAIQYNDAKHVEYAGDFIYLYEKKGDAGWSVQVPKECLIEAIRPCRIYNPLQESTNNKIELLIKEIRSLKRKLKVK